MRRELLKRLGWQPPAAAQDATPDAHAVAAASATAKASEALRTSIAKHAKEPLLKEVAGVIARSGGSGAH